VREIISIRLAYAGAQETKALSRKNHKKCIFHVGTCVRLTDVIKRAQFHRYNLRGFGAVMC